MLNVRTSRLRGSIQQLERERNIVNRLDLEADPFGAREDLMPTDSALGQQRFGNRPSDGHVQQTVTVQMTEFTSIADKLNSAEPVNFQTQTWNAQRFRFQRLHRA